MAKVVGVFNTAHTPFCFMPPENWNAVRATRPIRADVPMDDLESSKDKSRRIAAAFVTLKAKLAESKPDVIVVFGDDQMECFDFRNFPAFAVYVGEEFEGALSSPEALAHDAFDSVGMSRDDAPDLAANAPEHTGPARGRIQGHPGLATGILRGLMARGFDPAFSMDMPKPEDGLGHAFMRPAETLTDLQTPIIPILMNCYYAPQPTGIRSYEFGKAVRAAIDEYPENLRVAIVGSGGLWHTPGAKNAYLDETFDRESLALMEKGDIKAMAEYFDNYKIPEGDTSQELTPRGPASTGMPAFSGPQGGTRETCNWIAASAAMDGTPGVLIDYVPVYASPIGTAFAYWMA